MINVIGRAHGERMHSVLAAGGILGAGLGMALAPTSGRELRQLVAKRLEEGKQRLTMGESSTDYAHAPNATGHAGHTNPM